MHPRSEIKEPRKALALLSAYLSSMKAKQTGTACAAYHGTLRTAVLEAAGSFFVEAVVRSGGFSHLLHDHLRFNILLCSGVYCDMGPLEQREIKVHSNAQTYRETSTVVRASPSSLSPIQQSSCINPTMPAAGCIVFQVLLKAIINMQFKHTYIFLCQHKKSAVDMKMHI